MFTADESGTVTLPLTIPPGSLSMGHHGPGAPPSATQGLPLGAGLSLGSQVGAAASARRSAEEEDKCETKSYLA